MLNLPGGVKINGCLCISTFSPGEHIAITQHEDVVLKNSCKGKKTGEIIIEAERKGILHKIILVPFPKGENLYKIESFSPVPLI